MLAVGVSDVCVYHRRGSCEDDSRQTTQRTSTFIYLRFFFVQAFLIVERDPTLVRSAQVKMCAFSYRIGVYMAESGTVVEQDECTHCSRQMLDIKLD